MKKYFVLLAVYIASLLAYSLPQLPEGEPGWKNVMVDGKKAAVYTLFRDSRGIMWLGTNIGLYFYDGVMTRSVGRDTLAGSQIYAIVENDGCLYLGSNNGLFVYDFDSGAVKAGNAGAPKEIRAMLLADGRLWIGSLNGLYRLDMVADTIADASAGLPHRSVYSLLRDSRGILYAGTYRGLARWNGNSERFNPVSVIIGSVEQPPVFANCLLESGDSGSIYMGGEGSLFKYSPVNDRWEKVQALESNNIKSMCNAAGGHVLIGTDNGVFDMYGDIVRHYRHDSRRRMSLADNEIWSIYADSLNNVWTGHVRGISIASASNNMRTIQISALGHAGEGNEIYNICRDSRGNLWFTGNNGAIRLSDNSEPLWYRHSDKPGSLSHNRIRAIHEDADRRLWFASDAGINLFDSKRGTFDVYHIVDSIGENTSNWVYSLVEDGEYLWTASFLSGLHFVEKSKFRPGGGTVVSDRTLNASTRFADGASLANNLVNNAVKDTDGNIWILLFRDSFLNKYRPGSGELERYDVHALTGAYPAHICLDSRGRVWCAFAGGAIVFDKDGNYRTVHFPHTNSDESVMAMGRVSNGVWVSTLSNVWKVDGDSFSAALLPIPQKAYTAVFEDSVSGKVFLGGTDEILEVDMHGIGANTDFNTIKMVLNGTSANDLSMHTVDTPGKALVIPYGGSITLVVSTLNYSPDAVHRYLYKLADSPDDTDGEWVLMPEGTNTITFSDLKMGSYSVLVKTVGSPAPPVDIPLTVEPPFMLSWWAIALYIIAVIAAGWWIVWYTRRRNMRAFHEQERQTALENVEKKLSFLSSISHDLKTPLSMIMGPVSLMKERVRDPESKRNLETIYDNAVRLNNMIHRTLELQHMEDAAEDLLILSTFDVVEFCRGVFEVFRENNPHKNFVFHASCPQLFIEADAVKLESVITNLLSNACKYSDEGATVSLGIRPGGDSVEITVSDDGLGIADIDQPLVFQRMFRAPATSGLREGTGLGLYLIKKYLELMKGNIDLYSKEGQGTSFVVTLPVSDKKMPELNSDNPTADSDRPKVLIVEDNAQISEFIVQILADSYTSLTAANGRSGLAIAASFLPDIIIADEMMPIMSGMEMVRRLKQNPRLATIPIIMLTARNDNKTETESIKLGIDVFMGKPFEPTALLGRISQLLKARTEIKEKVRIQTIAEAESKPIEAESVNEKSLARIARIIEDNISDPDLNVNLLCEKSGIPNKQLYRLIKKYMGVAPLDYIRSVRLRKAAMLLSQHRFTVAEISYMVGFKTPSYFAKCFQNHFGVKPSQYHSDDSNA